MEKVLVSACLLGEKVRYHGGDAACADPILKSWLAEGRIVRVCPEREGDLPTPRPPAEIAGGDAAAVLARIGSVRTAAGADVTHHFFRGAERALQMAQQYGIRVAVLKDGSPSCGTAVVFDGSFSGKRVPGTGVTTALLKAHGVRVFNETELATAQAFLQELEAAR